MTKSTDCDAEPAKAGLFEDLPMPSLEQVERACAPVTCTRAEQRPRNHEVSSEIGWLGDYAGNRKTLDL